MELQVFPSDFGLPSIEADCLQFLACTKFCAAPIRISNQLRPWKSPNGTYPTFRDDNGTIITDFEQFVNYLRHSAQDVVLDGDLTSSQKSQVYAFSCMLKARLYPAQLFTLWMDDLNFNTVTNHWFASHLSFPYNMYYIQRRRKAASCYLHNLFPEKMLTDVELELSVIKQALFCINMLAAKLGDNKYFYGDKPSSLDALVFGYLAPLLKLPLPNDRLQQHLKSCSNIVRFVESIISIYLPLSDDELSVQRRDRNRWEGRRLKAQETSRLTEDRITQEATVVREKGNLNWRDTVLFAMAAVSLTLLFAVHTGLVGIQMSNDRTIDLDGGLDAITLKYD